MSSSIDTLSRKLDQMIERIDTRLKPRVWRLVLETGEAIPLAIRSQMGPRDTVVIREIPRGFWDMGDMG